MDVFCLFCNKIQIWMLSEEGEPLQGLRQAMGVKGVKGVASTDAIPEGLLVTMMQQGN